MQGDSPTIRSGNCGRPNRSRTPSTQPRSPRSAKEPPRSRLAQKKKLSYLEAREYATIEQRVAEAEAILAAKRAAMEDPAIASDAARIIAAHAEFDEAQKIVDELYARWAELDSKIG